MEPQKKPKRLHKVEEEGRGEGGGVESGFGTAMILCLTFFLWRLLVSKLQFW